MRDLAEELAAERFVKYYGGFVDPDSDHEIVSSITKKPIRVHNNNLIHTSNKSGDDEAGVPLINHYATNVVSSIIPSGDFLYACFIILFAVVIGVVIGKRGIPPSSKSKSDDNNDDMKNKSQEKYEGSTAKSSACPRAQNLFSQFEKVSDDNSSGVIYKKTDDKVDAMKGHSSREDQSFQQEQPYQEEEHHVMCAGEPSSPWGQSNLRRRCPQQMAAPRARPPTSPSSADEPPSLVDEFDVAGSNQHRTAQSTIPPHCNHNDDEMFVSSTPTIHPTATPPRTSPIQATPTCDQTMESLVQHSASHELDHQTPQKTPQQQTSVPQTPQEMTQDLLQTVHIIKQELAKSSSGNDEAFNNKVAVQLAMRHQKSLMKQKRMQEKLYQKAQKDASKLMSRCAYLLDTKLPKTKNACLDSVFFGIYANFGVCALLEAMRHASTLMRYLEYFSRPLFLEDVFNMACGCAAEEEFEAADEASSSYFFSWGASFFSSWDTFGNYSRAFSPVLSVASYSSCILGHVIAFLSLRLLHGALRQVYMPSFLHQLVNIASFVIYLAQNPNAWIVVTNLWSRYLIMSLAQAALTVGSFAFVMNRDRIVGNYIKERQSRAQKAHDDGTNISMTDSKLTNDLRSFESLALDLIKFPAMTMGVLHVGLVIFNYH